MIILTIIVFGMFVGWLAQLVVGGRGRRNIDWGMALVAGLVGSLIGGLLGNLLAGEGFDIHPSGLIGSFIGACIVVVIWEAIRRRRAAGAS